ncbi:hypothetical protein EXIGLDRAFT_845743 [Exidia glandulosa HHB12029]|uniref:F-box domain-containing protein n=1 Tax=Exidia glandulosa HHB12029 TaxID=1314781 RepID=A0A165BAT9_EXIGL|nr:hypothetical protein EXIGLDRAFT_845743 [Exidia glandulosa HHB12029]
MSQSSAEPTAVREPLQPTLLPNLERELASLVLSVFQKTLAVAGPATLDIITQTVAAVQRCVTATLAPELRIYNARLAPAACLPDEVLCMIWELLCVEDRVKVSHICSSWRSLAINTPRLWGELDLYSAVHNKPCFCSLCGPHAKVTSVPRWNPPSVTNRSVFRNVLARSRSLPLSVRIEFILDDTPIDEILEIAQFLEPHYCRIQDLSFVSQVPDDVVDFFSKFSAGSHLPNLRTLHCTAKDLGRRQQRSLVLPALPSAETVVIRTSLLDCTVLQLPLLRRLHCRIVDEDDILSILDGCPKLEILTLDMNLWESTSLSNSTIKSICSRAARLRLQEVVLLFVDYVLERDLLAIFYRASLRRLWIYYYDPPAPPQGFTIFQDLETSVDLVVSADTAAEEYRISATDLDGRCRTVQCPIASEAMLGLWKCLSHGSVTTLTLPAETWSSIIQPTIPILPCVRSATFLFDEGEEYSLNRLGALHGSPLSVLPGLSHLRLACSKDRDSLPDRPHVSVVAVEALVSFLRGSVPVDTLVFDNVELFGLGDRTKLASLVVCDLAI